MFGINDQLNLGYTNSLTSELNEKYSRALSLGYSIPFGYWTFTNNASFSGYQTYMKLPVSGERLYSFGDNFSESFIIDRVLSRGQRYKLSASLSINYKKPNNYTKVLDIKTQNASSSRGVSFFEYALPTTFYFDRGIIFVKPSFVDGANFWGVEKDDGTYPQKTQFDAYKLYLYSNWNFGYVSYTMAFDGQYTEDEVLSSETVYVGGETSVRGFKDGVSGDSGFYLRNDLSFNLPYILKTESLWAKAITPSLFFDYGLVKSNVDDSKVELSGSGMKIALEYGFFDTSISYAVPIKKEDNMTSKGYTSVYVGIKGRI